MAPSVCNGGHLQTLALGHRACHMVAISTDNKTVLVFSVRCSASAYVIEARAPIRDVLL